MTKKNHSGKYIKIVVALALITAAVFGIYYIFMDKNKNTETQTTGSSAPVSETTSITAPASSTTASTESTAADIVSSSAEAGTTTKQAKDYELPLSINQALNALEEHYGTEYDINATIEEEGIHYFALYKDDEKYASVAINLSTGKATETIMETNQKTDFYLV